MKRCSEVSTLMRFFASFMQLITIFPIVPILFFQMSASGSLNQQIETAFNMISSFFTLIMKTCWDLIVILDKRTFGFLIYSWFIIDSLTVLKT